MVCIPYLCYTHIWKPFNCTNVRICEINNCRSNHHYCNILILPCLVALSFDLKSCFSYGLAAADCLSWRYPQCSICWWLWWRRWRRWCRRRPSSPAQRCTKSRWESDSRRGRRRSRWKPRRRPRPRPRIQNLMGQSSYYLEKTSLTNWYKTTTSLKKILLLQKRYNVNFP